MGSLSSRVSIRRVSRDLDGVSLTALVALSALGVSPAFVACDVAEVSTGTSDAHDTRDAVEVDSTPDVEVADGLVACDPNAVDTGCKTGQFCETTAHVCVDCVGYVQRCVGSPDRAKRETCEQPHASGLGQVDGGFFEPDACPSGQVCTSSGLPGADVFCKEQVCEPGFATCLSAGRVQSCNASGTEQSEETCGAGKACYTGSCEPIRHNVLLIFDTSASMWSYIEPTWNVDYSPLSCDENPHPCFAAFPDCDNEESPLSLFTLSKNVFTSVVQDAIGGYSQFALQRFPQRETPGVSPSCGAGWYTAQDEMTGDDDAHATDSGTWFKDNLGQALVVPFPVRTTIDNTMDILGWIDHRELLGATPDVCVTDADCGDAGRCGDYNGQKRCYTHSNNELRAISQTPLGKSLFYAGEYIRRFVRVDGKGCNQDADCDSAGYLCRNNTCVDPYRKCKDDFIVLFTDGGESFHQDETDFFNPVVQAKRLAFGLDCTGDSDCRGGATCIDQKCIGPGQASFDTPSVPGDGVGALSSFDGEQISIKTTVITLNSGPSINARIAYAGGGANLDVSGGDPASFALILKTAMTPNYKCRPEDIE